MSLDADKPASGLSLIFANGQRPGVQDVERLLHASADSGSQTARISHRPDEAEGWVELLASGLTFDLAGLMPAPASGLPPADYRFGLTSEAPHPPLEALALRPGDHIASGETMLPVLRVMAGLAARLAALPALAAVAWGPARCWMEPDYFRRIVEAWLAGGAFPALGLTALKRLPDGSVESVGLAFFTGQEVRVDAQAGEPAAATVKLAMRIIDLLVSHGRLSEALPLTGPDGEALLAEPGGDGTAVHVRRGG